MKLSNLRRVGRYRNKESGQEVNIHRGRKMGYGVDVLFYLRSGSRVFVSDYDLSRSWERVADK